MISRPTARPARRFGVSISVLIVAALLAACGADMAAPAAEPSPSPTAAPSQLSTSSPEPELTPSKATPTPDTRDLAHQPNELGQVLILEYHTIDGGGGEFVRSPEQLRADLQWLYENDFYVIPIRDYLTDQISAPAGKRPVVLTFDDGVVSRFRYIAAAGGGTSVDPDSAIGILEASFSEHPDFGRGGLFAILPLAPFAWPDSPDQLEYAQEKLEWLLDNGYEIGNHTLGHANLAGLSTEEGMEELAAAADLIHEYVPNATVEVIAVPFGGYPDDEEVLRGFEYDGKRYEFLGALMVGASPAPSPSDPDFDPFRLPRIQASDEELGKWFAFVEENPDLIYVSDGDPDVVSAPQESAISYSRVDN